MEMGTKPRELIRDQLPYGGAVNIHGEIVWRITKEEHDAMKARVSSRAMIRLAVDSSIFFFSFKSRCKMSIPGT